MYKIFMRILIVIACFALLLIGSVGASPPRSTLAASPPPPWQIVASPNPGIGDNILYGVSALSTNDIWAVGYDNTAISNSLIIHWDGSSWNVIPSPNPGVYSALDAVAAASSSDIWAVGYSGTSPAQALIEHWDGSAWTQIPNTPDGHLTGITVLSATDIWAVGQDGSFNALTMHWDGSTWSVVASPLVPGALSSVTAASSNDIWAVGQQDQDETWQTLTEHWDGTAWSIVPSGQGENSSGFFGVTAAASDNVWAVGQQTTYYNHSLHSFAFIEHWNGTQWLEMGAYSMPSLPSYLIGVVALDPYDVWAVGQTSCLGNHPRVVKTLIENGSPIGWQPSSSPAVGSYVMLNSIVRIPGTGQLVAVGTYRGLRSSTFKTLIETYQ